MEIILTCLFVTLAFSSVFSKKLSTSIKTHLMIILGISFVLYVNHMPYIAFLNLLLFSITSLFLKLVSTSKNNIHYVEKEYRPRHKIFYFSALPLIVITGCLFIIIFNNTEYINFLAEKGMVIDLSGEERIIFFVIPQVFTLFLASIVYYVWKAGGRNGKY